MVQGTLKPPEPFSLGLTLLCGQAFRWEGPGTTGSFQGIAGGARWVLRQENERLSWECSAEEVRGESPAKWISRYLGFDDPLAAWTREFQDHPFLGEPLRVLKGLRLLRQEPWECAVSYMFAQGLSVKVIRHVISKFCSKAGSPLDDGVGGQAFPEASQLVPFTPEVLRPFTNNYLDRADRIIRLARAVEAKVISLDHLRGLPCDEARDALMALDGIGPKIADCILLFSLDQYSAFPVDRWVLRAMKRHFRSVRFLGAGEEAPTRTQYLKIVRRARKELGPRCGVASEYFFLYLRLLEDEGLRRELSPFFSSPLSPKALREIPRRGRHPKPTERKGPKPLRVLERTLERLAKSEGRPISEEIPFRTLVGKLDLSRTQGRAEVPLKGVRHLSERRYIREVLERTKGNQTRAAALLGLHRNTLILKIKDLGLEGDYRRIVAQRKAKGVGYRDP
jgi:N-glycosylase/DNA lyase